MFVKIILLIAAATLGVSSSIDISLEIDHQFIQFVQAFGKKYASGDEYRARRIIFESNLQNAKYLQANELGSATFGVTKFSDLTAQEFASQHLLSQKQLKSFLEASGRNSKQLTVKASESGFDWRKKGAVGPVESQGQLGSSLVYAYQANINTQYFKQFGNLPSYAAEDLCSCPFHLQCRGAAPSDASSCQVADKKFNWTGVTALSKNEDDLATWLPQNAPFVSLINATPLQLYTGGILHPATTECNPDAVNHAVALVGYGEESATPFWIGRNSWGAGWGEQGYFRIFKGSDVCGLADTCTSAKLVLNK